DWRPAARRVASRIGRTGLEAILHLLSPECLSQDAIQSQRREEGAVVSQGESVSAQGAINVGGDAIVVVASDRGKLRKEGRRRAYDNAEPAAAQETDPVAELHAEPLQLELPHQCGIGV